MRAYGAGTFRTPNWTLLANWRIAIYQGMLLSLLPRHPLCIITGGTLSVGGMLTQKNSSVTVHNDRLLPFQLDFTKNIKRTRHTFTAGNGESAHGLRCLGM